MTYNVELSSKPVKSGRNAGMYQIFVRATMSFGSNVVHKRYGTGVYVDKKDFNRNARHGKWIRNRTTPNEIIKKKLAQVEAMQTGSAVEEQTFFQWAESWLEAGKETVKRGTWLFAQSTINDFKRFAGEGLRFDQITPMLISAFITHMAKRENKGHTMKIKMSALKKVFKASGRDYDKLYFFSGHGFKVSKKKKEGLDLQEIILLKTGPYKKKSYQETIDLWLFCMYNWGMRASDAIMFKVGAVHERSFSYSMRKTDDPITISMSPQAYEIFERWSKGKGKDEYLFNFFRVKRSTVIEHNILVNRISSIDKRLIKIVKEAGIVNKHITMHSARHTWARMADKTGVDRRVIQRALGHESMSTTEKYLDELSFDAVDELNRKMFGDH